MNYDHLIVPGVRAGPVQLGGRVRNAIQHLGQPDLVNRSTFRELGINEVFYWYDAECIEFSWSDVGVEPKIPIGTRRGINISCDKWRTSDGLHVGLRLSEVVSHLGEYCAVNKDDGSIEVETKEGIFFQAHDRNSAVSVIRVMPKMTTWDCRD